VFGKGEHRFRAKPIRSFGSLALPNSFFCVLCAFLRLLFLVSSVIDRSDGESFSRTLTNHGVTLQRGRTEILQLNVGKLCDLTCAHCHVNAGPKRKEVIKRETIDRILNWLAQTTIPTVDITGGAPEMAPDFRYLVEELRSMPRIETIIDRCNLTILLEPNYEWAAEFLAASRIKIVASMPCYQPANVNAQRGDGVFELSIRALQLLNRLGYGRQGDLTLDLVYNPNGDFLPPDQTELEADYKRELKLNFDIDFNRLYTITNMPIGRFAAWLKHSGRLAAYMDLLIKAFNPASVSGLMCRNTLSVGWRGEVYDCDFNQQLGMQWRNGRPLFLWDLDPVQLLGRTITIGNHCFGCTAGAGSSCGGAIV
jgi:radical SAM/Cys-rich protein